jgi:hypothetical protein
MKTTSLNPMKYGMQGDDPGCPGEPLATFAPLVREVFARKAYEPAVLQPGVRRGLPPLAHPAAAE